jgi:multisubunit Na+/H+ antiporter MnhE subunit
MDVVVREHAARLVNRQGIGYNQAMARAWIAWFVALNLLWLLLISAWVPEEEVLGLFASALAATAAVAVQKQGLIRFKPRLRWLLAARSLPLASVRQSALVLAALARQLAGGEPVRGRFRTEHVSLPSDPDESATKRALLIAGRSFPPNTYVLGIDPERESMLVHELIAEEPE